MPLGQYTGGYNWRRRAQLPEVQSALQALNIPDYKGTYQQNIALEQYMRNRQNQPKVLPQLLPSTPARSYVPSLTNNTYQGREAVAGVPYTGRPIMPTSPIIERQATIPQPYISKMLPPILQIDRNYNRGYYGPYEPGTDEDADMSLQLWNDPIARGYNYWNGLVEKYGRGTPEVRDNEDLIDNPKLMNRNWSGPNAEEFKQRIRNSIGLGSSYCAQTGCNAVEKAKEIFGQTPEEYNLWKKVVSPGALNYIRNAKRYPQDFAINETNNIPTDPGFIVENRGEGSGHVLYAVPDSKINPTGYYVYQGNSTVYDNNGIPIKPEGVNRQYVPIEIDEYGNKRIPKFLRGTKYITRKTNKNIAKRIIKRNTGG